MRITLPKSYRVRRPSRDILKSLTTRDKLLAIKRMMVKGYALKEAQVWMETMLIKEVRSELGVN